MIRATPKGSWWTKARRPGEDRSPAAGGFYPAVQVAEGMADFAQQEADFRGICLLWILSEIRVQGVEQVLFMSH
jgi:hypothetical protein